MQYQQKTQVQMRHLKAMRCCLREYGGSEVVAFPPEAEELRHAIAELAKVMGAPKDTPSYRPKLLSLREGHDLNAPEA